MGAIVELFIKPISSEMKVYSPSVQVVITENPATEDVDNVVILSTHEQVLDSQTYTGCVFPANDMYRRELCVYGKTVGSCLASKGVLGHFSLDFMCVETSNGSFDVFAVEIKYECCF
jgi:hypothetical protein